MRRALLLVVLFNCLVSLHALNQDDINGKSKSRFNDPGDSALIISLINHASTFDINSLDQLDSSLFYLNKALLLAQETGSTYLDYNIFDQYSKVFMKSGNFSLALEYYFKMLKLLDDEASGKHDTVFLLRRYASLYTQIGTCYFNMDNFKSLDYYRRSLDAVMKLAEIDPDYPAREREMMIYVNIGSAYLNNYDFTEAERNFNLALELNQSLKNPLNEGTLYNNLGIVFKEKKDFEAAFNYYQKAIDIRSELKDSVGLAQTYNNLGDAFCLTGNYNTAIEVLNSALLLSRKTGNLRSEMKAANFLSVAFEKTGEYSRAFEMYKVYTALHDSIISNERVQNAIRLEMQYLHEKQVKENELQQQIIIAKKERKALIYMVISGVLLFSVTILILLNRNQRMRMRQAELIKEKLEMELDFRNKELSTHVIYLLKKNEFISSIFNKLLNFKKSSLNERGNESWIQDLMRDIQSNLDNTVWNEFEIRFQQVHKDFYRKLAEKYPDLTPNEIKICAFLKLNMTTKDISAITFQSVKSIQVARNRLRRKMGIEREENLVSLLQQL
jgi:tetratricopeptide (TPR) repeat protein